MTQKALSKFLSAYVAGRYKDTKFAITNTKFH